MRDQRFSRVTTAKLASADLTGEFAGFEVHGAAARELLSKFAYSIHADFLQSCLADAAVECLDVMMRECAPTDGSKPLLDSR